MTEKQVLALARKRYGNDVELRKNPKALDAAGRAALNEKLKAIESVLKSLRVEAEALGDVAKGLRESARFVLDVDGDEPSWSQLREWTEKAERVAEIAEERKELRAEQERLRSTNCGLRFQICRVAGSALGSMVLVKEYADTLDELASKIQAKAGVSG